jgi:hypothetical protein
LPTRSRTPATADRAALSRRLVGSSARRLVGSSTLQRQTPSKQNCPVAQSALRTHWTQLPPSQTGVPASLQSELVRQATHTPSLAQSWLTDWPAQSLFAAHSTQVDTAVSQTGVLPEHCALDVHPGMQVKVRGLQIGFAAPQSELFRHATQLPLAA